MKQTIALIITGMLFFAPAPAAAYTYIHNDGEYSIDLPDAPVGRTIWADEEPVPYLEKQPRFGAAGEYANLRRVDPGTGDYFDVRITFIKASRATLDSMTKEKIRDMLENDYKDFQLDKKKLTFSNINEKLKWGTLTGFSIDKSNNLIYNAAHFLTGTDSLTVIRVQYSVENEKFNKEYIAMNQSIKYVGR
jgi:hypothetical protein